MFVKLHFLRLSHTALVASAVGAALLALLGAGPGAI
jgi:hypothetical protein